MEIEFTKTSCFEIPEDVMTVENGLLFVNGKRFIPTNIPNDDIHGIEDGRLVTKFRGHLYNYWYFEELEGYFPEVKKKENKVARDIVAMLMRRERDESVRMRNIINDPEVSEFEKVIASTSWAQCHNDTECARRILYGREL